MPIYEYQGVNPDRGCRRCRHPFELLQGLHEALLDTCPDCGGGLRRVVSLARPLIPGSARGRDRIEQQVSEYERRGMFSHAAELADKASESSPRAHLKSRAMENYKKAGYDV